MSRITFIGGTGFIGHAAAAAAIARGHDVTVIHRGVHPAEVDGVQALVADRTDPAALRGALTRAAPDVVIDTRAMTRVDAETTLAALRGVCDRLVVLSSQDVYEQFGRLNGLPAGDPEPLVSEDSPLTVPYPFRGIAEHAGGPDYDKNDVEALVLTASTLAAATVLRLPAVYGPRDPARRFGVVVDALDRGEPLPRQGGGFRWTHAHVDDVAHAILLAAESEADGTAVFNVGEAQTPTMAGRAEQIAAVMGATITWDEPDELPAAFALFGSMPNDFVADTSWIRERLGYAEVLSPEDALASLVAGLRASREE